jgi:hypothetical protein
MRLASERASLRKVWVSLLVPCAILVLSGGAAHAQNLDQGKSPAKLFADGCAACHHSPRGLAKGRFRLTLFLYLQDHYASNSSSAWALPLIWNPSMAPRAADRGTPRSLRPPPGPLPARLRQCRGISAFPCRQSIFALMNSVRTASVAGTVSIALSAAS